MNIDKHLNGFKFRKWLTQINYQETKCYIALKSEIADTNLIEMCSMWKFKYNWTFSVLVTGVISLIIHGHSKIAIDEQTHACKKWPVVIVDIICILHTSMCL